MSRRLPFTLALLLATLTFGRVEARPRVVVTGPPGAPGIIVAPPAVRVEVRGAQPSPHHHWVPGYWAWRGRRHVWISGRWMLPPAAGQTWIEPRWNLVNGQWVFTDGYWAQTEAPGVVVAAPPPVPVAPAPPGTVYQEEEAPGVQVEVAPPPMRVEEQPPPPAANLSWVPGRWRWHRGNWTWVEGRWHPAPRVGAAWAPGHWEARGRHWVWVGGGWR
jgi:hypothetical protein